MHWHWFSWSIWYDHRDTLPPGRQWKRCEKCNLVKIRHTDWKEDRL